jgi:ATP-dependent Clp protease ATP-binding subunit ClpA
MGPFDRFNDRAKRVLALAQDEAIRFNHNYIGVEHLLLGLVREGEGAAARALASLGVELSKVRTAVEFAIGRGDSTTSPTEITLSPRTKKVIEFAIDEAQKLGHKHVGTEHLLLGIVREGTSMATGILESLGLTLEKVRQQVIATLGQGGGEGTRPIPRFRSFAGAPVQSGQQTMMIAAEEARKLGHDWIGSEHILLAITKVVNTQAAKALASLSVDYDKVKAEVQKVVPPREGTPNEMTLTPRAQKIVGYASGFGDASGHGLAPETLLLALVVDSDGIAAQVLTSLGATPQRVREALQTL